MPEKGGKKSSVMVNRAPVLTLWAALVAEGWGFEHDEALTSLYPPVTAPILDSTG